jgi:hypothetical protein
MLVCRRRRGVATKVRAQQLCFRPTITCRTSLKVVMSMLMCREERSLKVSCRTPRINTMSRRGPKGPRQKVCAQKVISADVINIQQV